MANLVRSADVFISGEVDLDSEPIGFSGGRNIGPLPTLYDADGHYVEPVNLWFISLVASRRLQDLSSYSRALLRYWSFIEQQGLTWNEFPPVKALKPTYRFRNQDLIPSAKSGQLAWSTANTYMSHVVQFYLWTARNQLFRITEQHKPFEVEFVQFQGDSMLAHMVPKFVVRTSDLRIRVPRDAASEQVRSLNPLSRNELQLVATQLRRESIEFRLMCALGAQCGMRIEEAAGLSMTALDKAVATSELKNRYHLTIGPISGVPTKYDKTRTIEVTKPLLSQLQHYSISERRIKRLEKLNPVPKHEPLFITQHGNPFSTASLHARWSEFRRSLRTLNNVPFSHRFHDLRASYGTYRLHSLLEAGLDPVEAMDLLMGWMGHRHEKTTWKYLRYLKRQEALKEKISMLDSIMNQALAEGIDE